MMQWNFYLSGILYGRIYETDDGLFHEALDVYSGEFTERMPFTDGSFYRGYCARDLHLFFRNKDEYEERLKGEPASFTTEKGEVFQNRRKEAYFQREKKYPLDLFYENGKIYAVVMSSREYVAVLVQKGKEEKTILGRWKEAYPEAAGTEGQYGPSWPVSFAGTFQVTTRDGEQLATDVYLPVTGKEEKFPAVLIRTPYGKDAGVDVYYRFVQRGYAVVIQDTRGREDSSGEWQPNYYEVEDGDDTLNWIAAQHWSDGQVGMSGGSYLGYVQWAAAASGNPHLKAILSSVCAGSAFTDVPRRGGCFNSGMLAWAFAMTEQRMRDDLMVRTDWDEVLDIRPVKSIPEKALGHEVPFLTKWLEHKDLDDLWKRSSWKDRYEGHPVPALIMSGWFDDNGMGTTEALDLTEDWPKGMRKVILGPWKHSGNADFDLHGVYMGEDALRYDIDLLCMKWLEHYLKHADNGIEKTPGTEYYTLGDYEWKTADTWPPQKETVSYYLDGDVSGAAAGNGALCGAGRLCTVKPESGGADTYLYDPEHPSIHKIDMSENEIEVPEDYTEEEKREDLLSYSTSVLEEDLTVTGDLKVHLYISCDCPDTDLVVRLTDVDESGKSVKLADGVISVRYRNGFEKPEFMEPGNVYPVCIRTTKISNTFRSGHRIRLTVTSSAKNFIFPNSNTEAGFDSLDIRKANVTIHHGGEFASWVELPLEYR